MMVMKKKNILVIVRICLVTIGFATCSCQKSEPDTNYVGQLLHKFNSLYTSGQLQQAMQTGEQLWEIREVPDDTELSAEYLRFLGRMQLLTIQQGKYVMSEQLCLSAMSLLKKLNKQDTPAYLSALTNLSRIYYFQGKYEEAFSLISQLIPIREAYNEPDIALGQDYYYLGQLTALNGYNKESASYFEKSYSIIKNLPDTRIDTSTLYENAINLANIYIKTRQTDKAKEWSYSVTDLAETWKGQNSTEYARAMRAQALYNYFNGSQLLAEQQWLKALKITVDNKDNRYIIDMANILGDYYSYKGSYSKADTFFTLSVQKMDELQLEQNSPIEFVPLYYRYIKHLMRIKKYEYAEAELQRTLAIYEKLLGINNPNTLEIKYMLDSVQTLKGRKNSLP